MRRSAPYRSKTSHSHDHADGMRRFPPPRWKTSHDRPESRGVRRYRRRRANPSPRCPPLTFARAAARATRWNATGAALGADRALAGYATPASIRRRQTSSWSTTSTSSFSRLGDLARADVGAADQQVGAGRDRRGGRRARALAEPLERGPRDLLAAARVGDRARDDDGQAGQRRVRRTTSGGRSSSRTSRSTPSSRSRASSARVRLAVEVRAQARGDLRPDVLDLLELAPRSRRRPPPGSRSRPGTGAWRWPRRPSGWRGRSAPGAGRRGGCGRSTRASGRPTRRRCRRRPAASSRSSA